MWPAGVVVAWIASGSTWGSACFGYIDTHIWFSLYFRNSTTTFCYWWQPCVYGDAKEKGAAKSKPCPHRTHVPGSTHAACPRRFFLDDGWVKYSVYLLLNGHNCILLLHWQTLWSISRGAGVLHVGIHDVPNRCPQSNVHHQIIVVKQVVRRGFITTIFSRWQHQCDAFGSQSSCQCRRHRQRRNHCAV